VESTESGSTRIKKYQGLKKRLKNYYTESNKQWRSNHDQNFQEFWDIIKKPNLIIHGVEEGMEIQTKGIEKLFNEIIAEISSKFRVANWYLNIRSI
jgi:hypothetical protein